MLSLLEGCLVVVAKNPKVETRWRGGHSAAGDKGSEVSRQRSPIVVDSFVLQMRNRKRKESTALGSVAHVRTVAMRHRHTTFEIGRTEDSENAIIDLLGRANLKFASPETRVAVRLMTAEVLRPREDISRPHPWEEGCMPLLEISGTHVKKDSCLHVDPARSVMVDNIGDSKVKTAAAAFIRDTPQTPAAKQSVTETLTQAAQRRRP